MTVRSKRRIMASVVYVCPSKQPQSVKKPSVLNRTTVIWEKVGFAKLGVFRDPER